VSGDTSFEHGGDTLREDRRHVCPTGFRPPRDDLAGLYFYATEPHGRPHVEVRGPGWRVKVALDSLETLAISGTPQPGTMRQVLVLLRRHQQEAIDAFHATAAHRFPGTLDRQEDDG
jgi:hypothetical protein